MSRTEVKSLEHKIDADSLAALPRNPGVYIFKGEGKLPLYIGKSIDIRSRVLSHLRTLDEASMIAQTRRIDFIETAGEIGALLLESRMIKEQTPLFNQRLRRIRTLCSIRLNQTNAGALPEVVDIRMGQPWFECKHLAEECGILALSSNYALYADMSNRVMSILSDYSPRHEVYSIDECFVDLTGTQKLRDVSYEMRDRVIAWTGIPVCVGIGPTKTLAKLANHIAKKHPRSKGIFNYNDLSEAQQVKLLSQIEVGEVWGVGRRMTVRLAEHGTPVVLETAPMRKSALGLKVFGIKTVLLSSC